MAVTWYRGGNTVVYLGIIDRQAIYVVYMSKTCHGILNACLMYWNRLVWKCLHLQESWVMQMNLIKTFFTGMDCNAFYVIISFHPELFVSYSNLFMYLPSVNLLQTIQFVSELLSEWFRRNRQPNQKIWLFKKNRLKIVIRSLVLIIHVRQKIRDTRHH